MAGYPVTFDIAKPARYTRANVLLRIAAVFLIGIGHCFVFLLLPLYTAFLVLNKRMQDVETPVVQGALRGYIGLCAYAWLLTDQFDGSKDPTFRFEVRPSGKPTVVSALGRYVLGIPHMLILSALGSVAGVIWFVGSVMILVSGDVPEGLYDINRAIVRWLARYAAYHASLVEEYPRFAFDMGAEGASGA